MLVAVFIVSLLLKVTTFCSAIDIRLKQDIKPISYEIKLYPDLENGTFKGQVLIDFEVKKSDSYVSLHGKDIQIQDGATRLERREGAARSNVPINKINITGDVITLNLNEQIFMGEYRLEINYNGKIRDDMTGFYRSYYYHEGKKRWLGATQFEPFYARRAFPCFDEPHFRTNFTLTIRPVVMSESTYEVISNVKATNKGNNGYQFKNYPSMPTYLLAWIVYEKSSFVSTEPLIENGIEHRVWTQIDYINQTTLPLTNAPKLLNALSNFLDVPYTLKKMDQIAIPDFQAGAMENWGIVTYREAAILNANGISTTADLQKSTSIVAHEFTHQWFGNLVTLDWWSYTWLNEAFARYFQYYIIEEVYSDWKIDDQFVVQVLQSSMEYDSSPQNAMTSEINNSSDINNKFDTITYSKGASVVRMMDHILKRENFKLGLSRYIKTLSSNKPVSIPDDLFNILSTVAPTNLPTDLTTILRSWIDQPGYPVVTVSRKNDNTITLSQKRGLYTEDNSTTLWHIPLTFTTKKEANFSDTTIRDWFSTNEKNLRINLTPEDWIIFNIQQKGFYRVSYDDWTMKAIIQQLNTNPSKIGNLNRAQIIDDAFFFTKAGKLNYDTLLSITAYLKNEVDYVPWHAAVSGFNELLNQFHGTKEVIGLLKEYILYLLDSVANNVGFVVLNDDKMIQKHKRMKILDFAGKLGHPGALHIADQIVKDLATNSSTSYHPDVQQALLCAGLRNSNDKYEWQSIYTLYKKTSYATQKLLYLYPLACTENNDLLKILVTDTISQEPEVRRQDTTNLFKLIGSTPYGAKFLLTYVTSNYEDLVKYNFNKASIIGDIINGFKGRIYDTEDIHAIIKFNTDTVKLVDERLYHRINNIVTSITKRIETTNKNKDAVQKWLSEFFSTTISTDPTAKPVTPTGSKAGDNPTTQAPPSSGSKNFYSAVLTITVIFYNFLCCFVEQ